MEEQIQKTEVVNEGLSSLIPSGGNAMTSIQNAAAPGAPVVRNILEQQEIARNLSETQLIEYAKSPNPDVIPSYLVTAELMRRKSAKDKEAKAPDFTVAQEVVAEAEQGLMNQMQQQQASNMPPGGYTPPREEVTRETIMKEGIAPLPNPGNAMGQGGMAQGGIVGYKKGDMVEIPDDIIMSATDILGEPLYYPGQGQNKIGVEDINIEEEVIEEPFSPHYDMGKNGQLYIPMLDPNQSFAQYKEQRTEDELAAGISQDYYKDLAEDYKKDREQYNEDKDNAGNMSMINAGIAMMGSKDPNFLGAAATGAKAGMSDYTGRLKDLKKEDRLLTKQDRLLIAGERAEKMGDLDKKEVLNKEWRANNMEILKQNVDVRNAGLSASKKSKDQNMKDAVELTTTYMKNTHGATPSTRFNSQGDYNESFKKTNEKFYNFLKTGDVNALAELNAGAIEWVGVTGKKSGGKKDTEATGISTKINPKTKKAPTFEYQDADKLVYPT